MGYVTVTEYVGEVMKTYHFSSYDDFKDWENEISSVVVSATDEEGWIQSNGEYPPKGLSVCDFVQVKFKNGQTNVGIVEGFYGWNEKTKGETSVSGDIWDIAHYRKLS